jgi:hypothetical protein
MAKLDALACSSAVTVSESVLYRGLRGVFRSRQQVAGHKDGSRMRIPASVSGQLGSPAEGGTVKRLIPRGSLLLAAVALATSGLATAPASAAVPKQVCRKMTGSVTIKPGLTTIPRAQKATARGKLSRCTGGKTGGAGAITATLRLPPNSSCQGLATGGQTIKLKAKITWKNKKLSYLSLTAKTGTGSNATVATITGKVSKGLFVRHPVKTTIRIAPKAGENCTPGHPIKHLTFKNTKAFIVR